MSAIALKSDRNPVSSSKRNNYNKLLKSGYTVNLQAEITDFWDILETNLMEKFQARPVHSLDEILLLKERFPKNIVCCTVSNPQGEILAGTLLYLSNQVVRTQYTSASHEGKQCKAVDFLLMTIIRHYAQIPQYLYFDFGTSMADDNVHLNESLILQKETLGGCTAS